MSTPRKTNEDAMRYAEVRALMREVYSSPCYSPKLVKNTLVTIQKLGLGGQVLKWMTANKHLTSIESIDVRRRSFVEVYDRSIPRIKNWAPLPLFLTATREFEIVTDRSERNIHNVQLHEVKVEPDPDDCSRRIITCVDVRDLPSVLVTALHLTSCGHLPFGDEISRPLGMVRHDVMLQVPREALHHARAVSSVSAAAAASSSNRAPEITGVDFHAIAARAPPCIQLDLGAIAAGSLLQGHDRRLRIANAWHASNVSDKVLIDALRNNETMDGETKRRRSELAKMVKNSTTVYRTRCDKVDTCAFIGDIESTTKCAAACGVAKPKYSAWSMADALTAIAATPVCIEVENEMDST